MISGRVVHRGPQSAQERRALSRLRQLLNEPGLLRASWVQMTHTCGKSYCRCAKAKRYWHLSWYVRQTQAGKPRLKSVPRAQLDQVHRWVARYQAARRLLATVGDLYWERVGTPRKR
jgi:hypothetical protein